MLCSTSDRIVSFRAHVASFAVRIRTDRLALEFSPLANPLADPQSYYLESDASIPLGDKTPLILVHGIDVFSGPPSDSASGWDNFCTWFYNTPLSQQSL